MSTMPKVLCPKCMRSCDEEELIEVNGDGLCASCRSPKKKPVAATLEYKTDRESMIMAGVIVAILGVAFSIVSIVMPNDVGMTISHRLLFGSIGILAICAAIICFTYKYVGRIDSKTKRVEKTTSALWWSRSESYNFSEFREVGITLGSGKAGSSSGGPAVSHRYRVDLVGSKNVPITSLSSDCEETKREGAKIAELMDLRFDPDPKTGFFGSRF